MRRPAGSIGVSHFEKRVLATLDFLKLGAAELLCFTAYLVAVFRSSPGHLWLGLAGVTLDFLPPFSSLSPHLPGEAASKGPMGLQSYSALLYLSRGKHNMLYVQQ